MSKMKSEILLYEFNNMFIISLVSDLIEISCL